MVAVVSGRCGQWSLWPGYYTKALQLGFMYNIIIMIFVEILISINWRLGLRVNNKLKLQTIKRFAGQQLLQ